MADSNQQSRTPADSTQAEPPPPPARVDAEQQRNEQRRRGEREEQARRQGYRTLGVGLELAAAVGGMAAFGWWIGGYFDHAQAGLLVGAAAGFAGGMYNLIKAVGGKS